ncbi:RabGAP/TBC [Backusella circina FSU 941]|nr:RabGAP/TBC [Backusella circina FSU 941]
MEKHSENTFWRRQGLKLPGSVSVIPSWTDNTQLHKDDMIDTVRYNYTSLVSKHTTPLPSAPSPHKSRSPTLQREEVSITSTSFKGHKKDVKQHNRSTSKSFNAFLKDTNDEWSDDIDQKTTMTTAMGTHEPADVTIDQQALAKATEAVLMAATSNTKVIEQQQQKQPKMSSLKNNKEYLQELLLDPTVILKYFDTPKDRMHKFIEVLSQTNVDLVALRSISWSGIPQELRMMAWQLLLGYLPCNSARREMTLARKRKEYGDSVTVTYAKGVAGLDQTLWHQIHIDIPRTNPGVPLYQYEATQLCLERILYQWAIRHPASGYVQGINDLVTPIFEVFLSAYIDEDPEQYDVSQLDTEVLSVIEADSFWCLSKLLDGIQDNYTFAQPGIQRQIVTLKELVSRIDARLTQHLQNEGIEFIQFAFRWMNCLLMRELPLRNTIRMWDTYLAEGSSEGFSEFHVYVCAAFLVKWSNQLQKLDFQGIMIFLQQLPTQGWEEKDVELLLSEAFMWKSLFHNAPNHLKK